MINPFKEANWHPQRAELRRFAWSLLIGLFCLALLLALKGRISRGTWQAMPALPVGGGGIGLGLLLWALPFVARPFYVLSYAAACSVGFVVGNVFLAVLYYILFTGIGLLRRACSRRLIRRTVDRQAPTYWADAQQAGDSRQYYRQF